MTSKKARIFVFMSGSVNKKAPKMEDKKNQMNEMNVDNNARAGARTIVTTHRIAIHIYRYFLGVPEILSRFIGCGCRACCSAAGRFLSWHSMFGVGRWAFGV